jgi:hypothetical protein
MQMNVRMNPIQILIRVRRRLPRKGRDATSAFAAKAADPENFPINRMLTGSRLL